MKACLRPACAAVVLRIPFDGDSYNIVAPTQALSVRSECDAWGSRVARTRKEAKFEVFGQEMVEKVVAKSGSSGRVYLPPNWIGKRVKVIRVE